MKIKFSKPELQSGLSNVAHGFKKESPIPVLEYVRLEAPDPPTTVRVSSTNLDIGISVNVGNAVADKPGAILIPGKKFLDIVNELNDAIDIATNEKHEVSVKSGKSSYKLYGNDPDKFPQVASEYLLDSGFLRLPAQTWMKGIQGAAYACYKGRDGIGNAPSSMLVEIKDGVLAFVATDGHRLAMVYQNYQHDDLSVTVQHFGIKPLSALLRDCKPEEEITIAETDNKTFLWPADKRWCLTIQKSTGKFPNYRMALDDKEGEGRVELVAEREALVTSLKMAAIYADRQLGSNAIQLVPNVEESTIDVRGYNSEGEEAVNRIPFELKRVLEGEHTQNLNFKYLLEFLKSLPSEKVRIVFRGKDLAVEFTDEPEQNPRYRYVVMTIRR